MPLITILKAGEQPAEALYKVIVQNPGGPFALDEREGRVFEVGVSEGGQATINRAADHAGKRGVGVVYVTDDVSSR